MMLSGPKKKLQLFFFQTKLGENMCL